MYIFLSQVGTRRRRIEPLLDRWRKYLKPCLTFLVSVTRVRTHVVSQGEIALAENENANRKQEAKYADRLWDDKVHFSLDCIVISCAEA